MYGEPEKKAKPREYKHMTFYEAADMAKKAQVQKLWLTHYSPSLIRPEEYMQEVRNIFPAAVAAKDGMTAELNFEEET
jgi:ribonuclease Z